MFFIVQLEIEEEYNKIPLLFSSNGVHSPTSNPYLNLSFQ
jgi:hypothetical protein